MKQYGDLPPDKKFSGTHYRVKRGETLSTVAKKFGISTLVIQAMNHFEEGSVLHEADSINLPVTTPPALVHTKAKRVRTNKAVLTASQQNSSLPAGQAELPSNGRKIVYEVKIGDTLWDISKNFNIPINHLRRWNGLGRHSLIRPGDKLVLTIPS